MALVRAVYGRRSSRVITTVMLGAAGLAILLAVLCSLLMLYSGFQEDWAKATFLLVAAWFCIEASGRLSERRKN